MIKNRYDIRYEIMAAILKGNKTINEIYNYLSRKYTKEEIKYWINVLITKDEKIVRNDSYYGENSYILVSKRQEKSPYTKHYMSFKDDNPTKDKKILLISDTHIGNKSIQNMELINKMYEYAKKAGCEYVFHEGDLFEGKEDIEEQLDLFIKEYPRTINKICLLGNHDEKLDKKISLKELSSYNDMFKIYELSKWATSLNNVTIHLSHRLYISWLINNQIMNCIDDIYDVEKWISDDYKVLISGHLHQGIIHSVNKESFNKLYLGVPSLSNVNINKGCAYIITITNKMINITVLSADNNLNIKVIDSMDWYLEEKNKVLHKAYL